MPDFVDDIPCPDYGPCGSIINVLLRIWSVKRFFEQQIVGYGGSVEWLPRSLNLTPLDVFLMHYKKIRFMQLNMQVFWMYISEKQIIEGDTCEVFHAEQWAYRITLTNTNVYCEQRRILR
ncbi:hypothetical protein TNCV_495161 [Trichonephila clavipes]|nr:hypothetical protein TNCV_495161 [Trichonephila clavipes]